MNYFSSDFKLGIIGGGQLGKMLLNETRKFDIQTHVLDPNENAPSRLSSHVFTQGQLTDYDTVYNFGKALNLITVEIEVVNTDALEALENSGVTVYPSAKTLKLIQNKALQKQFYYNNNIPTSPFTAYPSLTALQKALAIGDETLPFVWKSASSGYDGKGVKIIRSMQDVIGLPETECIAEQLIPFKYELAVIVARSSKGETSTYPVVEMEFHPEANQVEYVICPARISESLAKKATEVALKTSKAFEHVGLLAVELFATATDDILVNEVAPRPHNSGHFSIEASYTSQYEQHIRAIFGLPLGSTKIKAPSVMVNLVGEEGYTGQVLYKNIDKVFKIPGVTPHIYGKQLTRPFRKMGHITIINESLQEARQTAEHVKQLIKVISHA